MRFRSTLILAALLFGLLAFIYLSEDRGPAPDSGNGSGRVPGGTRLLPSLSAGRVELRGLTYRSRVGILEVNRSEQGGWFVELAGRAVPCDPVQVEELMTLARRCSISSRIPRDDIDAGRMAGFQLDPPGSVLVLSLADRKVTAEFGALSVARDLVYARRGGEEDVLLVDSSLLVTLASTTAADLRQRRVVDWSVNRVTGIEVSDAEGVRLRASRASVRDEWQASVPFSDFVDPLAMDSGLLSAVLHLDVIEFVSDGVLDSRLGEYGLDAPRIRIALRRGGNGLPPSERAILIGAAFPGEPGVAYVMEEGLPFVLSCRIDALSAALAKNPLELRDRYITRLGEIPVVRITGQYPGAEDFEFVHEHGEWLIEKPERQRLDPASINVWMRFMRDLTADKFLDGSDEAALGLAPPRGELRFWAPGEGGEVQVLRLLVGNRTSDDLGVAVLREGARSPVVTAVGLARLLEDGHFSVKRLQVFELNWLKHEVRSVSQRSADEDVSFSYDPVQGRWQDGADEVAAEAIRLCLPRLVAVRWLGRAAGHETEYGFDDESVFRVTMSFKDITARGPGVREHGVLIGAATDAGHYARAILDGEAGADVFLLADADYRILSNSVK